VPIAAFRADDVLRGSELVRFTRLSVMPLTPEQHARVLELAKGGPISAHPAAARTRKAVARRA
jgi:predicted RNA-binding protein with PUA-like domain